MKDWTGTSESAFKMLGASNHCDDEREENDYYATDPKAIDMLLSKETFNKNIWEPAAGGGHLSKRLKEYGYIVKQSDIIQRIDDIEIINFLKTHETIDGDIITNPPYKLCTEFILKALELIKDGNKIAMFLKLQTLEGQERYKKIFSKYPPRKIYVFIKRIECAKNGSFKGSSAVCYAWFIWEKGYKGQTVIDWL